MKKNDTLRIVEFKSLGLVNEVSLFTTYHHNFKFSDGQCITMRVNICKSGEDIIFDSNDFYYLNKYLLHDNSIEINTSRSWLWNEREEVDTKYIAIITEFWCRFHENFCDHLSLDDYGCKLIKEEQLNQLLSII
jgi:hypothetical protein